MPPNPAPAPTLPGFSGAGEEGAAPLLIPASSNSCRDPQPPAAWREVSDSRAETVPRAPQSCLLGGCSHLRPPVLRNRAQPWPGLVGLGQPPHLPRGRAPTPEEPC